MMIESLGVLPVVAEAVNAGGGIIPFQIIGFILAVVGLVFFLGTAVGMVRFPDFYTRMHAAGKGDSLSTMLILPDLL